jgi:cytoskeletal protein CcmA (bactofilin family)
VGIFRGKKENKPSPAAAVVPERERTSTVSEAAGRAPTVIGKDALVKGELSSKNDMVIDGRVEGTVQGGQRVVIGKTGKVHADISATVVSIRGEVQGDCTASDKIEITETGRVFGNISAQVIRVAAGATFRGSSKMAKSPQSKPVPPPRKPTEPTA